MKKWFIYWATSLVLVLCWASCKDEQVGKPAVVITELGYNNTGVAYIGGGLQVKANVGAQGLISNILVEVGKSGKSAGSLYAVWDFDTVYTEKYSSLIDTTFIETLPIPLDADTGMYRLYIRVEDMEGNQASDEGTFRLDYGKFLVLPI